MFLLPNGQEETLDRVGRFQREGHSGRAFVVTAAHTAIVSVGPHFYVQAGFEISGGGAFEARLAVFFARRRRATQNPFGLLALPPRRLLRKSAACRRAASSAESRCRACSAGVGGCVVQATQTTDATTTNGTINGTIKPRNDSEPMAARAKKSAALWKRPMTFSVCILAR